MHKLHIFFYGERILLGTNQVSIFENYLQNVQDSAFFIITRKKHNLFIIKVFTLSFKRCIVLPVIFDTQSF